MLFVKEFKLIDEKELAPLKATIDELLKQK